MSANHPLFNEALDLASGARERQSSAQKKKSELEARVRQLELEIENHKAAADRLTRFEIKRDGMLQCPRCWIVQEMWADLTPVPCDNRNDIFRCTHCRDEFVFPA